MELCVCMCVHCWKTKHLVHTEYNQTTKYDYKLTIGNCAEVPFMEARQNIVAYDIELCQETSAGNKACHDTLQISRIIFYMHWYSCILEIVLCVYR